ncbi:hypothetical protein LL240_03110 [Oceanimonas baumannii]|uniref:hypothetical protein n=1 Tax=Oceanimonas baumannii TaxID=129578 RepID=UPI001D17F59A|nr:hypothetical protein [Oceanimonas baumannii]MCC4263445.1 hypothetical protein [Oceanimonas baumannii]
MMNIKSWLRPVSALLALAGVALIWSRVVAGQMPPHGWLSLQLIAMALCVVHAVGWQSRGKIERWLFYPPLPWLLWGLAGLMIF